MPSIAIDGLDFFAVYEAAGEAIARARRGEGPTFIEAQTYRYYGHFEGDSIRYRTRDEEAYYRSLDCLQRFRQTVTAQGLLTATELDEIDARAHAAVEDAVRFAAESPLPDPAELLSDVYVDYPVTGLWPFQEATVAVQR
jgi:pyruvate dehydrogenase E1 component alpha subunit